MKRVSGVKNNSKVVYRQESIHVKFDGTPIYLEIMAVPIEFQNKKSSLVFVNDIAERKKLEQARIESEKQLSGIINSAMDAIVSVDEDLKIIIFNEAS